jgi:hypothetical protein
MAQNAPYVSHRSEKTGNPNSKDFTVYEMKNEIVNWSADNTSMKLSTTDFKIKVISFICNSEQEQQDLVSNTFYEIVGPYLVFRLKTSTQIDVVELPMEDGFVKVGRPDPKKARKRQ